MRSVDNSPAMITSDTLQTNTRTSSSTRSPTTDSDTARTRTASSTLASSNAVALSTSAQTGDGYHHGDLRTALIRAALEMLEDGEKLSLRAAARRAGVSTGAPYRHFADREALESALAVHGMQEMMSRLTASNKLPATASDIAEIAVEYVHFALHRPALFRLMFGQECDDQDDERVRAADALHQYLKASMARVFSASDTSASDTSASDTSAPDTKALAIAGWSLAHGLAFLHLDGKLAANDMAEVDERIRTTFAAVFPPAAPGTDSPSGQAINIPGDEFPIDNAASVSGPQHPSANLIEN